ncbi:MAG TPA: hypothetical protein VHZ50_15115 [Puia sp.]|jgi:hypothetical protein|nr:hypothetical protein [Puia sp.]
MKKLFLNKLARTDLILCVAVVALVVLNFFVIEHADAWKGILAGFIFGTFLFSIGNHVEYYKQTRKFY